MAGEKQSISGYFELLPNQLKPSRRLLATAGPLLVLELLFFVGPLAIMFMIATMDMDALVLIPDYSFDNYIAIFSGFANRLAIKNTIYISILTVVTSVILAYPLAYYIARHGGQYKNQLSILVMIPFWTNYIVRIYGWKIILGSQGVFNSSLIYLGILNQPIEWIINTKFSIWLGLVYLWLPFMILPLYSSLEKIDQTIIEAAYDLGASKYAVFRRIIFPLSVPGLMGGVIFVFIFSMGAYIVPAMLGGGTQFVGTRIAYEFGIGGDWPLGAALGSFLMLIAGAVLWSMLGRVNLEEMFR